ncbi:hypothetical protein AK812_SmicGene10720 [Symbiodinium microadriaticum]|uniref:Uncharacterized protein n=1 Tax=Symbiodinium microadriaticum TaxID=2951 RepID=A0A1Q9EF12_SYMMI|nr:hypothetical protein AK812_SmicGene10720 [Symbiodinium microadriaticum]CAE7782503.1 unnamed protein product [Symbiodinium microadriaticum]CAE7940957.1 unnamed protein product [Symbiodinium sp. KB8]
MPGRRSATRPSCLPLLLLVLANAHGEGCSGETSHGEACSGEASSLLTRKVETHPASTANDMTGDQPEHALRDSEEEASIFPENASDGKTSGFGPLASKMEFIFLKLAQLETVVELQQVEIQELKACGCAQQSTSAVEAKAKEEAKSRHAQEVLKSVLRKHDRQIEQREFATPLPAPKAASKEKEIQPEPVDARLDHKESADSASFIGKSVTDSAELAVGHLLSGWLDVGFGHHCAWSAPGLEISKEKIKMTMGRQKCELKITGKTYTIFDLNFDAVEVQWPDPLKQIISVLDCNGKDALQCLGTDIVQKVPPFNLLAKMDKILVEFIQVFARIGSDMAKTVTQGRASMIQAAVRSEFPAVGAAPLLHHSASNLQIRTHTQRAHSQHALSSPMREMSTLQEKGDDEEDKKIPKGIGSAGFSASDASYRSRLITQFDGSEFDTSSCLAFAPKTRSGVNNQTRKQDWQVKGDPDGFIQLEPFAVPCSPTFLQNHWDKWQGYSVYGWNLPVERCLTVSFGLDVDPVLSFVAGVRFSLIKELFAIAVSVCWPDFMPGGRHITSITAQARLLNTMVLSITIRNTRHRFRPDADTWAWPWDSNTHTTYGSVLIPMGFPRDGSSHNTRGLQPFPRSWLQNGSNTRHAQNISQTESEDGTQWATHVDDLYLATVEAGDGLNITKTSELRGEEVLRRMAAMSVLQDGASSAGNVHQLFKFKVSGLVSFDIQGLLEDSKIDFLTSFKFGDFGADSDRLRLFDMAALTREILSSMDFEASEVDKAVGAMSNITSNSVIKRVPPPMIRPGRQIALKSKLHKRYVRMTTTGVDSATQDTNQNADDLGQERFTVVDAGNGQIALHCAAHNRFVRMTDSKVDASPVRAISDLTADWIWERFHVVELANNQIALHSPAHNRFLSVSDGFVSRSEQTAWNQLPANWQWEHLSVVPLKSSLEPGSIVALHNAQSRRFLNMNEQPDMGCSSRADARLPDSWTWERLTVVDAGNGTIALHSGSMNRFVKMSGSDMTGSPLQDASPFPSSFTNEIFSVRYFPNSGGEEVALHNAKHNRFVRMRENGGCLVDTSAQTNLQDLPLDDGQLRFKVLKLDGGPSKASDAVYSFDAL